MECGKLVLRSPAYVCSTCQPSTEEDSDEDDEALQQRLERHEDRRQELLARKEKIIQDERERLAGTKKKQDEMIQRIKAIFAPDPAERNPEIEYCGRREGAGVQMVNRMTGDTVSLLPPPAPPQAYRLYPGRPRTAQGLPRKAAEPAGEAGEQTGDSATYSSNESDDEELKRVLRISAIFSGDDVEKLDAFLPADCLASPPPPSLSSPKAYLSSPQSPKSSLPPLPSPKSSLATPPPPKTLPSSPAPEDSGEDSEGDLEEILADNKFHEQA